MELRLNDSATGDVVVAMAHRSDLDAIQDLEARVFPGNRLSRRALRHHLGNPAAAVLVGLVDQCFAGYALILFRQACAMARLYSIAVVPEARGLGRHLLAACETLVAGRGFLALRLEVRADNRAAIRLYERAGYRRFGHYVHYYDDGATAFRYQRPLWRNAPPSPASPPHVEARPGQSAEACLSMILPWAGAAPPAPVGGLGDDGGIDQLIDVLGRCGLDACRCEADLDRVDKNHLLLVHLEREPLSRQAARRWVVVHRTIDGCAVLNDPWFAEGPVDNRPGGRDRILPPSLFQRMRGHGSNGRVPAILVAKVFPA